MHAVPTETGIDASLTDSRWKRNGLRHASLSPLFVHGQVETQ